MRSLKRSLLGTFLFFSSTLLLADPQVKIESLEEGVTLLTYSEIFQECANFNVAYGIESIEIKKNWLLRQGKIYIRVGDLEQLRICHFPGGVKTVAIPLRFESTSSSNIGNPLTLEDTLDYSLFVNGIYLGTLKADLKGRIVTAIDEKYLEKAE